MEKRYFISLLIIVGLLVLSLTSLAYSAVFQDLNQSDFNNGTYNNTIYNGSAVVLSGNNLSGDYISRVFDAGSLASWDNLSWNANLNTMSKLFAVDGGGDVSESSDKGLNWSATKLNYGRTADTQDMFSDSNYLYILSNSNREVWRSGDKGLNWSVVNSSFSNNNLLLGDSDKNNNLFVVDASGDVYLSNDSGLNWNLQGDFNGGATNNAKAKGIGINSSGAIFIVDGSGSVFKSTDLGVSWTTQTTAYGGGTYTDDLEVDSNGNLYILLDKKIYKSTDQGVSWNIINNSFSSYSQNGLKMLIDSQDEFFIANSQRRIFKSTDSGVSWQEQGDLNAGATNNPKGLTEFILKSNITFQVRSCNDSLCSGEVFEGPYGADELRNNNFDETTYNSNGANMTGNVLLMHLNEASGNPVDSSGSNNSVSLVRGINYNSQGKFNSAFDFNGINGTIDLDYNDSNFNFSRSGAFIVSLWIKPTTLDSGGNSEIISHYSSSSGENRVWSLHIRNNVTRFVACSNGSLSTCIYATGTTKIETGNWYFVAGRWNGSNVDVYVNGVSEDPQLDILGSIHSTNSVGVRIGRDSAVTGTNPFNGTIDEISIWNRSLSDSEILNIYNKGVDNKFSNSFGDLNLNSNRYFQYKSFFTSEEASITPELYNVSVDYLLVNTPPSINLIYPFNGEEYGYNDSIELNFSIYDIDGNLDSCWYNVNGGGNNNINCSQNTTFSVSGNGTYTIYLFANDTNGEQSNDSAIFNVTIEPPRVVLNSPMNSSYFNYRNITLSYTPTDLNLQTCELWGDFTGNFSLNQTDTNPTSDSINTFNLNLSDGAYLWSVRCNDSLGDFTITENKTFYIDTTSPNIILTQPTGTKTSRTGIPLTFSVSDASPLSCLYNVYAGASLSVANTSVNCSSGSENFNVPTDGNFILNFYANDSAGNANFANSSFSVSTSSGGGSSGGGSGGGSSGGSSGGGSIILNGKIDIKEIPKQIVEPGEKKTLSISVENSGLKFLNKCKLVLLDDGKYSSWVSSFEIKDIGPGKTEDFSLDLDIPLDAEGKEYSIPMSVLCSEKNKSFDLSVEIIEKKIGFKLIKVERFEKDKIKINYSLEELSGFDQNIDMQFLLLGPNNERLAEINDNKIISANENLDDEIILPIDSSLKGEMSLLVNLNSDTYSSFVQENVVLGAPITGFPIFGDSEVKDNIATIISIVLFLGFAVFMLRKIFGHRKILKLKKSVKVKDEKTDKGKLILVKRKKKFMKRK